MLQQCGTLAATAFDAVKAPILAANPDATVEARAAAEWGLRRVLEEPRGSSVVAIAHQMHVEGDITRFLERPWSADGQSDPLSGPGWSRGTPPEGVGEVGRWF